MGKWVWCSGRMVVFVYGLVFCLFSIGIADAWQPNKPVEFVVPAGSGGGADQMARFISPLISKYKLCPTPWIVINNLNSNNILSTSRVS